MKKKDILKYQQKMIYGIIKKIKIINSSDDELIALYEKVNYNIKHSQCDELIDILMKEKEIIILQFKIRGIKIPKIIDRFFYRNVRENISVDNISQKTPVQCEFLKQMETLKKDNENRE